MLTSQHCDVFNLPFFQFAQLKKYQPESIPQIKADYQAAWRVWQQMVLQVSALLGAPFDAPHIERWCNGWQVRAHFFAFFKYAEHAQSAPILSLLLNRRRLTVSLDWHCYKAGVSPIALPQYNQWLNDLDADKYADFEIWHGDESEYADYFSVAQTYAAGGLTLRDDEDFFCIGKHIERQTLNQADCVAWTVQQIRALQPLYEACFH
ncbi:MAG: HI_0552 family protein [Neisseria sp.]|uniref:HI_0552 family protein n=1 Tax=Neisseria sp. TaxID=192066 RepID=UPI0026DAD193|nr:HI_0552 family protein [Neisseria sp.]MDO4641727.1 HI_0552 family protein [Neisseria sp.]